MEIDIIRNLYNTSNIKWSTHCLERMQERDISIKDISKCIKSGEIIEEYPNDYPHPSCLILGQDTENKALHTVVGIAENILFIITAYYPNLIKFENDFKIRKEL